MLVVVSIVALLSTLLLPSLGGARERARATACASNVRQLALANTLYSADHRDRYCPGAAHFKSSPEQLGNLHRWHGTRANTAQPFSPIRGPLVPYLGPDAKIRDCPSLRNVRRGFEAGAGGYGYNNAFVGVRLRRLTPLYYALESDLEGAMTSRIRRPAETLLFADSAFAADRLIEYSFAEPRYHPTTATRADPSVHFRHRGECNAAWSDGHVDGQSRSFTWSSGFYPGDPGRLGVGWFGSSDDNRYFDLE